MEIAAALSRPGALVIPVLVGGARMPESADLPEAIRPLTRRHAIHVRDETWEADMDRLAEALGASAAGPAVAATATPGLSSRPAAPPFVFGIAAALLALAIGGSLWWFDRSGDRSGLDGSRGAISPVNTAPDGATHSLDTPSWGSEVAFGDLIYVVVAGSVQRRGDSQRVWLRVRASNEGYANANFWDDSFRLVVAGQTIAASGGLNELLERRSIRQGVVRFDVPSLDTAAILRVSQQGRSGDIKLDLSSNGGTPKHELPDERDSLSYAILTSIAHDETPLVASGDLSTAIMRIGRREFVNTQRITVVVKWTNEGRYPASTGDLILRLEAGGEQTVPVKSPSEVVAPSSTYVGDVVFEVPPQDKTATLLATLGDARSERPLTLHP